MNEDESDFCSGQEQDDWRAHDYWFELGRKHAAKGKGPIFRQTRRGVVAVGEGFQEDGLSESEAGEAYLNGYNDV